jgi:hypothetical protein
MVFKQMTHIKACRHFFSPGTGLYPELGKRSFGYGRALALRAWFPLVVDKPAYFTES